MAGTVKGIIVEIGGDTSGLQKALSKVNSTTSSLSKELRGVNSLLKLDPSNTEMLSQKQTVLKKNIEETSEKLEILKEAQKQADEQIANGTKISEENYRSLQREIASTQEKLNLMKAESSNWTQAGKSIEEFGNKITNISSKVDNLGNTLTTKLTVPIAAIATAAVTTGNNFEAQMSRVQAIAGATKEELEQLTDQAVELGAQTSFSATEVASGMENLASAGFTTNEIMDSMPGLLDLAASSGAELATASEIAASAIRGFGLEASEAGHVADVFAEAAARTNAQTEDMGEAMKYVAPVAKTVGLSIEETAAAIGIMSDAGVKGSQAGTTLRGGLTRIVKPTKQVKEAMETLGVEFYDSNGKMKSLTEIVDILQKSTAGLTDETKNQALAQIFGTEALSGMLALVNRGAGELDSMTKSFENADGAAEEMANTILDNTKGALESLSGSFESAGIAIQRALAPEIKDLAKWIQDLVDDFNELSDEEKENIVKTTMLVAAIGPAIKIIGKLGTGVGKATTTLGNFLQAIGNARNGITTAKGQVGQFTKALSLLISPVGLTITGITVLTGTLIAIEKQMSANVSKAKELKQSIEEEKQSRAELRAEQNQQISANIAEINNTQSLYDELRTITNENGKIKDGYQNRAKFITGELSSALGIEIKINGDVIQSYKNIQDEIDKTILKKKAEIYLNAQEENYTTAIQNRAAAYEKLVDLQERLAEAQKIANQQTNGNIFEVEKIRAAQAEVKTLTSAIDEQSSIISGYTDDVKLYEDNMALMAEGSTESLNKVIENSTKGMTQQKVVLEGTVTEQINTLQDSINKQKNLLDIALQNQDETNAKAYQNQIEADEKQLTQLGIQLAKMTSNIETLTPEQIEAWKQLANTSKTAYNQAIQYLPGDVQQKLNEIIGVTDTTTVPDRFGTLGNISASSFNSNLGTIDNDTSGLLKTVSEHVKNDTSVKDATIILAQDADKGFNDNVDGDKWGRDLTSEISGSMTSQTSKNSIMSAAAKVAGWISDFLHFSLPDKGPLADMDKSMPDMINLMTKGIDENKTKLLESVAKMSNELDGVISGNLQNRLNNRIINDSKTVFTTPQIVFNVQELDQAKLEQCFNYINKKFGSQY